MLQEKYQPAIDCGYKLGFSNLEINEEADPVKVGQKIQFPAK
jgi:hypothetical protein